MVDLGSKVTKAQYRAWYLEERAKREALEALVPLKGGVPLAQYVAEQRVKQLEAALREIAAGLMPEDQAAGQAQYMICAARLCGIARKAITSTTSETKAEPTCKFCGEPWPDYMSSKGPHGCERQSGAKP